MIFASRKLNNQIDEQNFMNMYYSILLKKHGITHHCSSSSLTLPVPCILESCIKIKINLNSYFHISLRCLRRFYEGFEAPKRSMKIKFKLIFSLRPWSGRESLVETFIFDGWALPCSGCSQFADVLTSPQLSWITRTDLPKCLALSRMSGFPWHSSVWARRLDTLHGLKC